ncbi:MAG: alpha/beta fold hydrolase [Ilumatobacteraceae bacterium]|nr:alpha/beta fold hydrolase [Ilumatobacteraceae bacterium]
MTHTEPATLPPPGLAGLEPSWSRLVTADDGDGTPRTWHVLDNWSGSTPPRLTLLCVHGNPSWSYLFRHLLANAPDDVRVVAVDHLDMGFSERTGTLRRLATRVDDLDRVGAELGIIGPTVTVAHDWGGPISLGWAQRHRSHLHGVVLMNTAVHQPPGSPAPSVIRLVRSAPMLRAVTTSTTAFIRGAIELSDERPDAEVREALLAPYRTADRRTAIGEFVADIPLEPEHPSAETLDAIAAGLADFADVPALLLWGAADRVFSDLYLHDLEARLPHADVHRYPTAGHFVSEDTDCLTTALTWIDELDADHAPAPADTTTSSLLDIPAPPEPRLAVAEMTGDRRAVDTREFDVLVDATAAGLAADGVRRGERVALMIPPGIDLSVTLMACWRAGAVAVLVDSGLGRTGMSAAMKVADPDHLIGIPKALAAARALRWPGRRICTIALGRASKLALGVATDLPALRTTPGSLPRPVDGGEIAAVAFTSGATGPSKGVLYTHDALAAQRDAIASLYDITLDDRLVAAFAPFALYGPLLGIPSVVPDMDVAAPGTLTATALGDAVLRVRATLVFASPAALANVVRTADQLSAAHRAAFDNVRLLLSAGAPVRPALLRAARELFPNASACTPYGMTECLPVASVSLDELDELAGSESNQGDGVCVGHPLPSVDAAIRPLAAAPGELTTEPDVVGEIVVRAPHQRRGYDRLWRTEHDSGQPVGWHATGDVGHLDDHGRLWVGGRIGHVITTPEGPVTPVALEQRVESVDDVALAAVVGVGPPGIQQIVVVVERATPVSRAELADLATHDRVREMVGAPVAAVFDVPRLPVDRRHNSKIDRSALARWAAEALAGGRVTDP